MHTNHTHFIDPAELFKGFEPLIGASSIQYANNADWDQRSKCLYHTLKGEDLRSYFPHFVKIAQVINGSGDLYTKICMVKC